VSIDPDVLLQQPAIDAGVAALANRNVHHLEQMGEQEREEAVEHWRQLAVAVLGAARAAVAGVPGQPAEPPAEGVGRAVIVFEDAGSQDIAVNVSFTPDLEQMDNGQVAGTPAQLTAISLLETLGAEEQPG
jgi:hypothetical protein